MRAFASTGPSLASTSTFDDSAQGHHADSPGKLGCEWVGSRTASLAGSAAAAWHKLGSDAGKLSEDSGWKDRYFVDVAKGGEVYGAGLGYEQGFGEEEEEEDGYGADEWRPLYRRPEMLFVAWACLLLAAATGVNVWVGLSGGRRQAQVAAVAVGPPPPVPPAPRLPPAASNPSAGEPAPPCVA